ncbi:TIGR04086 family membrane protein [Clostridiaceae bacterium 35-E11]
MKSTKNIEFKNINPIWTYGKGIFSACVFTLFIFVVMALVITYTNISETIIPMTAAIVMVISSAISGMYVGNKFKRKGWLHGIFVGLVYVVLLIFMSWIFINDFAIGRYALYKGVTGVIASGIGGIIGVNLK